MYMVYKMKKVVLFFIVLIFLTNVNAVNIKGDKIKVSFEKCIDGDTADFKYKDEVIKVRFLAIDTPELKDDDERVIKYGNKAKNYTCNKLKKAKAIYLEFDPKSDKKDKYDRYLAWVFVDNKLLQKEIVENGYAKVAYIYGKYKYVDTLREVEKQAKSQKLNIWSENNRNYNLIELIIIIIIGLIFSLFKRKKH